MYRTIDLAEHIKGEPFRYSHGWKQIKPTAETPQGYHTFRGDFPVDKMHDALSNSFGDIDDEERIEHLSDLMKNGQFDFKRRASPIQVMIGPNNTLAVVEGNHRIAAAHRAGIKSMNVRIYKSAKSDLDLAQPQIFGGTPKKLKDGSVMPKPGGTLVDQISRVLDNKDVDSLKAKKVAKLLAPFGVGTKATTYAMFSAGFGKSGGTAPTPKARLAQNGIRATDKLAATPARTAAAQELSWRAAFVIKSASKMQGTLNTVADREVPKAVVMRAQLADGSLNYKRHEAARAGRLNAAARAGKVASQFGSDLVGWYLNPALNNESECIAADGNNFYASQGTVLGWPGAVHPNCGCVAGPAHENGAMVNDSVNHLMGSGAVAKVFKLKRKAS